MHGGLSSLIQSSVSPEKFGGQKTPEISGIVAGKDIWRSRDQLVQRRTFKGSRAEAVITFFLLHHSGEKTKSNRKKKKNHPGRFRFNKEVFLT